MNKGMANDQKGQTIALVAVAMVSFVAMGALAIDLTSLYSARGEIQRAADAAALAGAKAFVDSGVTTDPSNSNLQSIATTMAQSYAAGAAAQNLVAKGTAQLVPAFPVLDFSLRGNPRITVTLQRTGLPLFFARIWGGNFASVSATAVAEAYNPSYSQSGSTSFLPSAPKCVKPLLVPNGTNNNNAYVNMTTGSVIAPASAFLGKQIIFNSPCKPNPTGCQLPSGKKQLSQNEYLPMLTSSVHRYCPSCSGNSDFEQSIECCDGSTFAFMQCGTGGTVASWDANVNPGGSGNSGGPLQSGLQCLTHVPNGTGQPDLLDASNLAAGTGPPQISPGSFNQTRYGISSNALIGTSDSIITVPLFDNSLVNLQQANHQVTIVGFLTLFVNDANAPNGNFSATILNVTGCGNSLSSAPPVSGGGVSAIPVRLIHN
jgi:Putative Flp pilus-assembly TadE/G-like